MKFTFSWLTEHLDTTADLATLAKTLTAIGLEVEGVNDPAAAFAPFTAAYVESAEKHPDADKLKVLMVRTAGHGTLQVVCGAPNARAGMVGIFAPEGSYIPGTDVTLKKGVIRGVESNGMMVSEREMGLSDDHNGIIDLPEGTAIGTPFAALFGMNDPVIEINVTPNRADCTGVRGIARDLAAAGLGTLKPLTDAPVKGDFKSPVSVTLKTPDTNPHFVGRFIKGVKNGSSPDWLQAKLKSVGLRPISALVDITNLMTIGFGRPMHVYDAARLKGNIYSRLAAPGESFDALNDKSYTLLGGETVICDDSGVIGLGGIVGGTSTGCADSTTDVFVEAAYFDPLSIARAGRALQIITDARYRFERGVDPEFTEKGMEIATRLILDICGGQASDLVVAGAPVSWRRAIAFDPAYTKKLSGVAVDADEQIKILTALGFTVGGGTASPPSWRGDVEGRADLVEEIIRIHGFDKLPATPVRSERAVSSGGETVSITRTRLARTALAARGYNECVTWSFMDKTLAASFGSNDNAALTLSNPISEDLAQMRPSILPNLIAAAQRNADRGYPDSALCEVGPVFRTSKTDGQALVAAGVRHGAIGAPHWAGDSVSRAADLMDVKADALAALEAAGAPTSTLQVGRDAPAYYHPGRSATLRLGKFVLAQFGDIHPAVLQDMGVKAPLAGFEVFLDAIPDAKKKGTARPLLKLSAFQPVARDFAFIVDANVEADALVRAAKGADKTLIAAVDVFDVYQGKGVEAGKKSIALTVRIQPQDATMTDSEIDGLSQKIIAAVTAKTGGVLRG